MANFIAMLMKEECRKSLNLQLKQREIWMQMLMKEKYRKSLNLQLKQREIWMQIPV